VAFVHHKVTISSDSGLAYSYSYRNTNKGYGNHTLHTAMSSAQ